MSCINYEELSKHVGHKIECVRCWNYTVIIECKTCNEVLIVNDEEDMVEGDEQLCI